MGSGYIRIADFASSTNDVRHSKYDQLDKCVVRRRSARVQLQINESISIGVLPARTDSW